MLIFVVKLSFTNFCTQLNVTCVFKARREEKGSIACVGDSMEFFIRHHDLIHLMKNNYNINVILKYYYDAMSHLILILNVILLKNVLWLRDF